MKYLIDFIIHIDKHLLSIIDKFGNFSYLILFLIVFCETGLVITPFLPGDSLLFAAGALSSKGAFDIWLVFLTFLSASILGDSSNYWIGRKLGVHAFKKIPLFKEEHLTETKAYFSEHGKKTVVLARFLPIIRTFSPFVAGIGHMEYPLFLTYSIIGSIIWTSTFTFAGYFFGNIPFVQKHFSISIMVVILVSLIPAVYHFIKSRNKSNANKKENSQKQR